MKQTQIKQQRKIFFDWTYPLLDPGLALASIVHRGWSSQMLPRLVPERPRSRIAIALGALVCHLHSRHCSLSRSVTHFPSSTGVGPRRWSSQMLPRIVPLRPRSRIANTLGARAGLLHSRHCSLSRSDTLSAQSRRRPKKALFTARFHSPGGEFHFPHAPST